MNKHSYKVLEFDKLLEEVGKYAILEETYLKFVEFEPYKDLNIIGKELEIVSDMMELFQFDGGLELSGITNINQLLKKIELIGTYLDAEELNRIKKALRVIRVLKNKLDETENKYKSFNNRYKKLPTYKGIEDLIEAAIELNGDIKDTASIDLRDIRVNKKLISANIRDKFDALMNNPDYSKAIQDRIITERDGRSVIPIKADFKGQIKGIEHDRSGSGQTVFIEPLSVVALNNKKRELLVKEREEIRKVLLRLTDMVRTNSEGISEIGEAILDLDFLTAKVKYSLDNNCKIPKLINKERINLIDARHPFIPKDEVVPLSFSVGDRFNLMLITGPNTGGKTVALKTAGLLTLMTQSAIPIPASEKTEIGVFSGVYADIGDEQSIVQNLSSFSAHLKNVQEILSVVNRGSLVLLDELGSGTDPMEGSAFAMAVLDFLREKNAKALVSTHYSEVKAYGYNEEGVESASMEFNAETLAPTYRLLLGIPGESNALKIARGLGISEEIIGRAEKYISEEDKKVESMIAGIKEKSGEVEKMQLELSELKSQAKLFKAEYEQKLIDIEKEKNEMISKAYDEANQLVKNAEEKAKALIKKIQTEDVKKEELKAASKSLSMLRRAIDEDKKKKVKKPKIKSLDIKFKKGEKVFVKSLTQEATVLKIMEDRQELQVQAGILKLVIEYSDVKKLEEKKVNNFTKAHQVKRSNSSSKIDLRGKMIDDAIHELESYLDKAMLTGYNYVQVVHGKGTGALRKGIQKYLKTSNYVAEFRDADQNEGGLGCTIVQLK